MDDSYYDRQIAKARYASAMKSSYRLDGHAIVVCDAMTGHLDRPIAFFESETRAQAILDLIKEGQKAMGADS